MIETLVGRVVGPGMRWQHARRSRRLYSQWVKPGSLVFDVGANIGARARVFLSLDAKVVAVEPQPECLQLLRRIRDDRLSIEPVALGAEAGVGNLQVASASTISSMSSGWIASVKKSGRFAEHEWQEPIAVEVSTLDSLVEKYGVPDFCKVDVEGYESQVVAGLTQPLPLLSFEVTPEWATDTERVVERLTQLGIELFNLSIEESHELVWEEWKPAKALLGHLKAMPQNSSWFGDVYAAQREPRVASSAS